MHQEFIQIRKKNPTFVLHNTQLRELKNNKQIGRKYLYITYTTKEFVSKLSKEILKTEE